MLTDIPRLEFRSPFRDRLRRVSFTDDDNNKHHKQLKYPYFLIHTLFHADDDNIHKIRKQFTAHQIFSCADDFREEGNNEFRKCNYKLALQYYEYVPPPILYKSHPPIGHGMLLLPRIQSHPEEARNLR